MSKQPSNQAKRNLLRRGLAGILSLALILGLLPSSVVSASAASWADPYVETLVDWGVMRGDIGGNMAPDRSITRAEFVAMMNRAYGYTKLGGHPFTDVRTRDWYNEDIDIGYNIGYFKGTSLTPASPNDTLTREQAAVLLARNMMLQETVGETLGFSDSRSLSDWSRGLVGAAAANGIISGYNDGTFQPFRNITRGEVAAMLVRAIGTPIQTEGEHALGNVYGNVTVNTSGVKLRDGVIVGNLYLTGGIDLGDVLLENVTVLGEIIVSGGGESNSSAASIVMRNVTADNMIVDSIADQFVTIRAEGVTDIPTTTVRTNAYVDDSSLPGYGLSYIELDGDEGTLLQLAGNVKEVWNKTPGSDLQVVQGSAEKITIDENATGSSVLVDGDARVDELDLDTATTVTGTGDIKNLNVGAAGSTVEQLPDNIAIRPGISADINGSDMNSTQAAESSADPKLLAGYPAVKNIAPNSATLVFRTNKTGTIYWAISAVADGSVSEADLMEPPVYGGNVLQSGTISATSANTDFTAAVTGLTKDGSYYVTAMLVDGRDNHSPIKVTSFSTPDDTVPAFNQGYPYMSRITTENSQVTVSTNKSCLLYYALLPKGSTAPTPAEFKANAISGNLGYGTIDTVKNVTQPFQVNSTRLKELTDYTLYLWLTDYSGAKSSAVISLDFKTPDEQPPVIVSREQTNASADSIELTFSLNEAATLYWAIVPEGQRYEMNFEGVDEEQWKPASEQDSIFEPEDRRLQIKIENGAGNSIKSGRKAVNAGYVNGRVELNETRPLDAAQYGSSFTMYLVAKDAAGNYSKVQKLTVKVRDTVRPTVKQEFRPANEENPNEPPANTDARLVFSERVLGVNSTEDFLKLYQDVEAAERERDYKRQAAAMNILASALHKYIKLYHGVTGNSVANDRNEAAYVTECRYDEGTGTFQYGKTDSSGNFVVDTDWIINFCRAKVEMDGKTNEMVVIFPTDRENQDKRNSALNLSSGATYHFVVEDVVDAADDPNDLDPNPTRLPEFTTQAARVLLEEGDEQRIDQADAYGPDASGNPRDRIDYHFQMIPVDVDKVDASQYWDMLIWFDANVSITLYSRPINAAGTPTSDTWKNEGTATIPKDSFKSLTANFPTPIAQPTYKRVNTMLSDGYPKEYAVHVDSLEGSTDYTGWNQDVTMRISVVSGTRNQLSSLMQGTQGTYDAAIQSGVRAIETRSPFTILKQFSDRKLPSIETGMTISVGDTGATVRLTLDRPGKVYYLALPLSDLKDKDGNSLGGSELIEDEVKKVASYSSPLPLLKKPATGDPVKPDPLTDIPLISGDPDWSLYKDGTPQHKEGMPITQPNYTIFTSATQYDRLSVIKDSTPVAESAGERIIIDLTGRLKANTVYVLCLLPSGQSTVPDDKSDIICYRFTTNMLEIPKLDLTGIQNPTIKATVGEGKSALMDYFLVRKDKEGDAFKKQFSTIAMMEEFNKYLATNSKVNDLVTKGEFTVLEAMATKCYDGSTFIGTVFDLYAKNAEKPAYADLVRNTSNSAGGNSDVVWGEQDRRLAPSDSFQFEGRIEAGQQYTIVAMARRDASSSDYAFAAWYPVQKQNKEPPMVTSATVTGINQKVDGGKNVGVSEAKIILQFDDYLHRWLDNTAHPIDGCGLGATGHVNPTKYNGKDYYSIGAASGNDTTSTVHILGDKTHPAAPAAINTITLEVKDLAGNMDDSITFDKYKIVGSTGNGTDPKRASLIVTVKAVDANAGTTLDPVWKLEVSVNSDWNAIRG